VKGDRATDLFLELSPERVLDAVDAAGVRCNPVCYPLNSFENRVYDIQLDDGTHVVAKFYRPGRWTRDQILEEHAFMGDLEAAEVPICGLRPFPDGSTLASIDSIFYCLYDRKGGRAPDEIDEALLERLGMLLGRLHTVGERRVARHRLTITADTWIRDNLAWMKRERVLPPHVESRYAAAALAIADFADARMRDVDVLRLHGDFHVGNILFREGILHVLDFDDMVNGPAVQDFWMILGAGGSELTSRKTALLAGYEHFRPFDPLEWRLMEPLRGMRLVHYAAWLARRWHDPVFPVTWPHFGTEAYWEGETADLEDLLRAIERDDGGIAQSDEGERATASGEPELTNADFFWDWDEDA
jgi:Ser/Thr protein kinase RdoA (MazF antagonist)